MMDVARWKPPSSGRRVDYLFCELSVYTNLFLPDSLGLFSVCLGPVLWFLRYSSHTSPPLQLISENLGKPEIGINISGVLFTKRAFSFCFTDSVWDLFSLVGVGGCGVKALGSRPEGGGASRSLSSLAGSANDACHCSKWSMMTKCCCCCCCCATEKTLRPSACLPACLPCAVRPRREGP